jgi:Holliday junction resolvase
MTESTIERAVCAYAKSKGCIVMKLSGQNQRGQPDRMFILDGKVLFIEFKAPGKRPTALQERWLADLRRQGMFATWCDDIGNGKSMVNFFLL